MSRCLLIRAGLALVLIALGGKTLPLSAQEDVHESVVVVPEAQQRMYDAMLLAQDENYAEAVPLLEAAIAEDPTLVGAWETLGWSYWHLDRKEDAEALWTRLARLNPDEPLVFSWLAQLAAERQELDRAAELFRRSIALDPGNYNARLELGRVHLWRGRLGEAIRDLSALAAEDPDRLDVVLELARARQYSLDYDQALPLWLQLLDVAPGVVEYRMGAAMAMLHTVGRRGEGVAIARDVLESEPRNVLAWTLLADDAEYGSRPVAARRYLYRAIEASDDPETTELLRRRLVTLLVRLYRADPILYPLTEAIAVSRDRVAANPHNVDARLLLAELFLMNRQYEDSESEFLRILREYNARNVRARRGLFELALARFQFPDAREHLDAIRAFNPLDPYLRVDEAMLHARQGEYGRAHQALDRLERVGGQGAVAALLYHVLTPSEIGPALPLANFRAHLSALREAGYRFLTVDELPGYLDQVRGMPDQVAGVAPTRAVVVTFDDGLEHAMRLATPVAKEKGLVFTQFLTVAAIEAEDALVADWEQLIAFRQSGRWRFGSNLLDAHDVAQVFLAGAPEVPLANRIWNAKADRLETLDEFDARLRREYADSRSLLGLRLGHRVDAVAYPFGDIGQESASNEPAAIPMNLAHAEAHYRLGFTVRSQGHVVQGDNPLLYGRFEPNNFMSGEDVVAHLLSQHPVFLAQRLRLEFATFEGRRGLARDTLDRMERSGYPEEEIERLGKFIRARLARKFDMPILIDDFHAAPWTLRLEKPFIGVRGAAFRDSLDSESLRGTVLGGLHVTPHLTVEGRFSAARHIQPEVRATVPGAVEERRPDVEIRERSAGLSAAAELPRRTVLTGAVERRDFSRDADWLLWRRAVSLNVRPVEPIDLKAEYEHDAVEGTRALRRELTHDYFALHGVWTPNDNWDVWGSYRQYEMSDGNQRTHWHVLPTVLLWREPGLVVGLRYGEDHSPREDYDYWTPYRSQSVHLEAGFRGSWRRHYYSLLGRVGQVRERIRPDDRQAHDELTEQYEALLLQARRGGWGRTAIEELEQDVADLRGNPPRSKWRPVAGIHASCVLRFGLHWEVEGLASYEESARYRETRLAAGLKYRF